MHILLRRSVLGRGRGDRRRGWSGRGREWRRMREAVGEIGGRVFRRRRGRDRAREGRE